MHTSFVKASVAAAFLVLGLTRGEKPANNGNHNVTASFERANEDLCAGLGYGPASNPELHARCPEYKITLTDDDKESIGADPSSTKVAEEAKKRGLRPVASYTIFGSGEEGAPDDVPESLNALIGSIFNGAAKGYPDTSGGEQLTFLKGVLADVASKNENGDKDKKKKEEDEEGAEDEEENGEPKNSKQGEKPKNGNGAESNKKPEKSKG